MAANQKTSLTDRVLGPFRRASKHSTTMLENVPINVMFADRSNIIRYANKATITTLHSIQHLLPIKVDDLIGTSIDIFHKHPEHQRALLSDPDNLPHNALFELGDEWIELKAEAIRNKVGRFTGVMVTWAVVTAQITIEREVSGNVAVAVEQMREAIGEIARSASHAFELSDQLHARSEDATTAYRKLSESSDEISNVVDLITNVTAQTKLLAINATIESARAGNAGKGFAIVAHEVKDLADGTRAATDTIAYQTEEIQREVGSSVTIMEEISGMVVAVRDASQSISAAVHEQSMVAEQISRNTNELINAFAARH